MSALVFDTLKYTRRLMEAGVPKQQAEVQAEAMAEAFVFNVEALVTRDYLDARLGEQDARIDKWFMEQDARIDKRFAEHGFRFERELSKVKRQLNLHSWMLALIVLTTVVPAVRSLLGY